LTLLEYVAPSVFELQNYSIDIYRGQVDLWYLRLRNDRNETLEQHMIGKPCHVQRITERPKRHGPVIRRLLLMYDCCYGDIQTHYNEILVTEQSFSLLQLHWHIKKVRVNCTCVPTVFHLIPEKSWTWHVTNPFSLRIKQLFIRCLSSHIDIVPTEIASIIVDFCCD